MKTKLGILNNLEANTRELVIKVSSNRKLSSSVLITAIQVGSSRLLFSGSNLYNLQALNGSYDNGLPGGTIPSSRVDVRLNMAFPFFILKRLQVASRNVRGQFPLIRTIEDLINIPPVTLRAYLEKYGAVIDGLSDRSRQYALGRCVGINEQAFGLRLGPL